MTNTGNLPAFPEWWRWPTIEDISENLMVTSNKETERFRCFTYDELIQRDKINLDIFWLKDESLEDSENLPEPDVIAAELVENLESALEQFGSIYQELEREM
jgi:hypothetical protein